MNPEKLAPILYIARNTSLGAPAEWRTFAELDGGVQAAWIAVAATALSALRGPRTGEDLHNLTQQEASKVAGYETAFPWAEVRPEMKEVLNRVAATFATPKPPEGWPEGFYLMSPAGRVASGGCQCSIMARDCWSPATVRGMTKEEAEESARLTAWTLANQQPVWPAQVEEHWRARAL